MAYRPRQNSLGDVLTFRVMITPVIIQIIFWIGVLIIMVFAGFNFFAGVTAIVGNAASSSQQNKRVAEPDREITKRSKEQPNWLRNMELERLADEKKQLSSGSSSSNLIAIAWMLGSLVGLVFGILAWRIYCELMIVMFMIHEELKSHTALLSSRRQYDD